MQYMEPPSLKMSTGFVMMTKYFAPDVVSLVLFVTDLLIQSSR